MTKTQKNEHLRFGLRPWHQEVLEEYRNNDTSKMLQDVSSLSRQIQNGYVRKEESAKEIIQGIHYSLWFKNLQKDVV